MNKFPIPKDVLDFALKHKIRLSRYGAGYHNPGTYVIHNLDGTVHMTSDHPTASSAFIMMRRFLRNQKLKS